MLGGEHLLIASKRKARETCEIANAIARQLQSKTATFWRDSLPEKTPIRRLVPFVPVIVVSFVAGAVFHGTLLSPPQVAPQEVRENAAVEVSPRIGGQQVGWNQLWPAPPAAVAMVRLSQPSVESPLASRQGEERPALAARSGPRESQSPDPTATATSTPSATATQTPTMTPTPQPSPTPSKPATFEEQFIAVAASAAQSSQVATGVPASVTIAQAILESDWGRSKLSTDAKNYFGIKATGKEGSAGVIWMNTWEVINGRNVTVNAPFRAYKSMADSFTDHGEFFTENARYAQAMKNAGDAKTFAREIHRAGYATDPAYSDKLIRLMDKFGLFQYDLR